MPSRNAPAIVLELAQGVQLTADDWPKLVQNALEFIIIVEQNQLLTQLQRQEIKANILNRVIADNAGVLDRTGTYRFKLQEWWFDT